MAQRKKSARTDAALSPLGNDAGALTTESIRAFIEVAPDAVIVTHLNGRIALVNRQAEKMFGYSRAELLGSSIDVLLPEALQARHIEHRQHYAAAPHTRPMGLGLRLHGRHKDGHEIPVEISLSPTDVDGVPFVISIVRDVTRRQALEENARRAEREAAERGKVAEQRLQLLQHIIDTIPSAVYLVRGEDARLALANDETSELWGAPWRIGQSFQTFIREHEIQIFHVDGRPMEIEQTATIRAMQASEPVRMFQEVIQHADGNRMPVLLHALPLASDEIVGLEGDGALDKQGVLIVAQDVTVVKEAERLKDEFIGIAAHELRNPLAALRGFTNMLSVQTARGHGPELAEWQAEAIEAIDQSSMRLVELTDDLLDVTRLQAGRLELHIAPVDVVRLCQMIIERQQMNTVRHKLVFAHEKAALLVECDALRLEQVLGNIIANAIKYSPDGGIITISVHIITENDMVEFRVEDHGIGIPADQQARIFGRFSRAENAQLLGITGTGLGLYLTRAIIERHNGAIWFVSTEGTGTTFFVRLPRCVSPAAPAAS